MRSTCCNAPVVWVSYNMEFPQNKGKVDHHKCEKCGKECLVMDENGQLEMRK